MILKIPYSLKLPANLGEANEEDVGIWLHEQFGKQAKLSCRMEACKQRGGYRLHTRLVDHARSRSGGYDRITAATKAQTSNGKARST